MHCKFIVHILLQLYNSLWVLACSIISFHFFLSCVLCFQLFTPIFLKSFLTSSYHLTLGLPFGLVAYGFHLYKVLATLSLVNSFYMPQPAQSFVFYISYCIFVINCFFQLLIYFESPLSVCLLCWAKYPSQYIPLEYQYFLLNINLMCG